MLNLKKIYLDYAATTPVAPEVIETLITHFRATDNFANPSSIQHGFGETAQSLVENARQQIATHLNCNAKDLIFTSGATEANNFVLKSVATRFKEFGQHLITSATEHKSVLDCCRFLETQGFQVTYLKPDNVGLIDLEELADSITENTLLVSIMHVNNETGVIQPIEKIAEITQQRGVFFHVDASQSVGKLEINLAKTPISFLSFSTHKFYGVKGIGGVFARNCAKLKLPPLIHGGGQENGLRSGTLPTHQILAMATALELAYQNQTNDYQHAIALKQRLLSRLQDLEGVTLNGSQTATLPNIVNLSFEGVSADSLIIALRDDVAISSGSACNSGAMEASYVLRAMGIEGEQLYGAVRLSFGRYTTLDDMDYAAQRLCDEVTRLRQLTKN